MHTRTHAHILARTRTRTPIPPLHPPQVEDAISRRAAARAAKDFAAADAVRLELEGAGVLIMDTPQGTTWRPGVLPAAAGGA
jgi:cysteinyl-tRNA synthetase